MDRPLLVLSDAHLSRAYGTSVGTSLSRVLSQYPDCEVILAGDIFDLSLDAADVPQTESLNAILTLHQETLSALRHHVAKGSKVTFVPGNHDAGLATSGQITQLRAALGAPDDRTVEVTPWFVRRGGVHIEHGHLYDPDCAPNHPLARPNAHSEGLGTALMRRFVAPHDALFFAHANQTTPSSGLKTALEKWGHRAPLVIADYFKTASLLCWETKSRQKVVENERRSGNAAIKDYAVRSGVPHQVLEALIRLAPEPTHHSFSATFFRLYFDRVFALTSLGTGVSLLGAVGLGLATGTTLISPLGSLTATGALLSTVGAGYLAGSTAIKKNRYGHRVIGQLRTAAHDVRAITQAELVVFGHTHVEVNEPGYVNLGSFGFGRPKKPFLLVSRDGTPERAYAPL